MERSWVTAPAAERAGRGPAEVPGNPLGAHPPSRDLVTLGPRREGVEPEGAALQ